MEIGQTIPQITLPAIDGTQFDSASLQGKRYLITFFRFASCPFCNFRVAQLVQLKSRLGDRLEVVAIFEASLGHLKKQASRHLAGFPILADERRQYYKAFGVRKSFVGMLKGMLFRFPTVLKSMSRGFLPHELSSRMFTMPLSLLVDEQGIIQTIYHGRDDGDHLPLEIIEAFANGSSA